MFSVMVSLRPFAVVWLMLPHLILCTITATADEWSSGDNIPRPCDGLSDATGRIFDDKLYIVSNRNASQRMTFGEIDLAPPSQSTITAPDAENKNYTVLDGNYYLTAFYPQTATLDVEIPYPLGILQKNIPDQGPQVLIPEQNISYVIGAQWGVTEGQMAKYDIARDKWDIRHYSQNKEFAIAAFVPMGKRGILVMFGGDELGNSIGIMIHVYGGSNGSFVDSRKAKDNHWILSLPTFTWIQAPSTSIPRERPNCDKMLEIVVLSTLEVVKEFSRAGEYEVPSIVSNVIGGKDINPSNIAKGGATQRAPKGGFTNDDFKNLLSQQYVHANFPPAVGPEIRDTWPDTTEKKGASGLVSTGGWRRKQRAKIATTVEDIPPSKHELEGRGVIEDIPHSLRNRGPPGVLYREADSRPLYELDSKTIS
ncbi:hypothetical protein K440DRAFT_636895 [Wilcoxina mikolae CBS 423.85]|nr:hypothetical protein K440DRAFT_636895 [Wilcoxina mikolae CBS 423.85]